MQDGGRKDSRSTRCDSARRVSPRGAAVIPRQLRQQGLERFDYLGGLLPNGAAPTDVDSLLEHRGHFLYVENKRPGQLTPNGQTRTFDRLVRQPNTSLLVAVGNPPAEIQGWHWWRQPHNEGDVHAVRQLVLGWWHAVER
jgi:hypothetical protein